MLCHPARCKHSYRHSRNDEGSAEMGIMQRPWQRLVGKSMCLTLGPCSSCEHTLFCLNYDGNSVTETSRVDRRHSCQPPPWLCPELNLCKLSIFTHGGGSLLYGMPGRTRGPTTSLNSLDTGVCQCPPGLWRLESPSSLAKGVSLPGHRPGLGDRGKECWPGRPSGSNLTNSSPCWSFEAILNCCNYRVSPGQWHHGVWAWLTLPGAILRLGRRCPAGEGILVSLPRRVEPDLPEVVGEEYWTEGARGPPAPQLEACRKQVIWLEYVCKIRC